jgi:hypothetical protein
MRKKELLLVGGMFLSARPEIQYVSFGSRYTFSHKINSIFSQPTGISPNQIKISAKGWEKPSTIF